MELTGPQSVTARVAFDLNVAIDMNGQIFVLAFIELCNVELEVARSD